MVTTSVSSQTFLSDTIKVIRNSLSSNITDPILSSRAGNERFVMTSYPDKLTKYPVIIVEDSSFIGTPAGIGSEAQDVDIGIAIEVFSRNVKQRDILTGSIYNYLRTNQRNIVAGTSGTQTWGLYGFKLSNTINLDNTPGYEGIRRKRMEYSYQYQTQP